MDASLLGSPSSSSIVSAHPVDLVALTLMGGAGDDRLIGSPFNDVIDGGTSDAQGDTLTGGLGYDIFRSGNTTAVDTLVETQNTDMGLYGNTLRHRRRAREQRHDSVRDGRGRLRHRGRAREDLAPSECAPDYITAHGRAACDAVQDPHSGDGVLRQPGYGENWRGTIVENIAGIFVDGSASPAGAGNNTIVVNAIDGTIVTDGQDAHGDAVERRRGARQRRQHGQHAARVLRDHDHAGHHDGRRHRRLRRRLRHRRPRRLRLEPVRHVHARRRGPGRVRRRVRPATVDRECSASRAPSGSSSTRSAATTASSRTTPR